MGLTLLIIHKGAVFAEILGFSDIFGFSAVNWAPQKTKNVNYRCVPFEPKFKILKDFSNTVFLIGDFLWSKCQQEQILFVRVRAQKIPKRGAISS